MESFSNFMKGIPPLTTEKKPLTPLTNPMQQQKQNQMVGPIHNPVQQQHTRSDGNSIFSASDDNVIMKQVVDTHLPDGTDVDVRPLLDIIQDILRHATINPDPLSSVLLITIFHIY